MTEETKKKPQKYKQLFWITHLNVFGHFGSGYFFRCFSDIQCLIKQVSYKINRFYKLFIIKIR